MEVNRARTVAHLGSQKLNIDVRSLFDSSLLSLLSFHDYYQNSVTPFSFLRSYWSSVFDLSEIKYLFKFWVAVCA